MSRSAIQNDKQRAAIFDADAWSRDGRPFHGLSRGTPARVHGGAERVGRLRGAVRRGGRAGRRREPDAGAGHHVPGVALLEVRLPSGALALRPAVGRHAAVARRRAPAARRRLRAAPSALSVALLVGYVAHVTAPVVHRCVADTWPGAFAGHARNRALCALLSGFAWCETVLLAVTVLSDWPSGSSPQPAGSSSPADPCSLPHQWSSAFSTFVCALYTLHVVVDLAVLLDMTASDSKRARSMPQPLPTIAAATESCHRPAIGEDEDDFFGEGPARNRVGLATLWCKFALLLLGTLPLVVIMFYHMVALAPTPPPAGAPPCPTFRDTLPVWTLLCTVLLGVTMPLVNLYADPVVSAGSLYLIRGLCCSLRRHRRVTPIRHA
ncbi:hypothetical protein HPB48_005651 [Haemaphysalis longicornis]|uniref:Uncharacterized protein n=1 Tax=Haemaphysalis longicornis TaxID=44386 RepID=A0A9J6G7C5_HAELO|nr:hypothetical protein HPB48_005651 [Haemaphysalis longicornis]